MNFWLVCFLLFFFGAEGLSWLGQWFWIGSPNLSHPLVIGAGIGLAIASNYSSPGRLTKLSSLRPTAKDSDSSGANPGRILSTPATAQPTSRPKPSSISFEIHKPNPKTNPHP